MIMLDAEDGQYIAIVGRMFAEPMLFPNVPIECDGETLRLVDPARWGGAPLIEYPLIGVKELFGISIQTNPDTGVKTWSLK